MENIFSNYSSKVDEIIVDTTASVHPNAQINKGVVIEKGAIIGPDVIIDSGTYIGPNSVIQGKTSIGKNNKIFPNVFLGLEPQDLKYKGDNTEAVSYTHLTLPTTSTV